MASYELIYIVSPGVTDEGLPTIMSKVNDSVVKTGGNVREVTQWGRKKLAYPIKKFREGNYIFARLEMKPAATKDIEANLKLSNEVIRHLLIKSNV